MTLTKEGRYTDRAASTTRADRIHEPTADIDIDNADACNPCMKAFVKLVTASLGTVTIVVATAVVVVAILT